MKQQVEQREKDLKANEKKWGKPLLDAGWSLLPNIILEKQQALGLDALDVNILLHLIRHWWTKENLPHPSKKLIAAAIGVDPRTVQRRIAAMEKGKLIERKQRRNDQGSQTNYYDFTGLIEAAAPYALEKIQEKETRQQQERDRVKRKGRPRLKVVKEQD